MLEIMRVITASYDWCVAACCYVLQCVAVYCGLLQCVAIVFVDKTSTGVRSQDYARYHGIV